MRAKAIHILTLIASLLLGAILLLCVNSQTAFADPAERIVSSHAELVDAVSNAKSGDTISLAADIIVDDSISIDKSLTIKGNGHSVKVSSPGFFDSGVQNNDASSFRVFSMATGGTSIFFENITIVGGNTQGGALYVGNSVTASLDHVQVTNSGGTNGSGGGIYNTGSLYISNSAIVRNGANYGGGFYNGGFMVIENSCFSENRSLSRSGGGGAGENGGRLYINNCTFSNNKSTELGGAINDYGGMAYIMNSTFAGNVTYHTSWTGGALRGRASVVVNCLFAYNYRYDSQTNEYVLNDYDAQQVSTGSSLSDFHMVNSIFHSQAMAGYSNHLYGGAADGSDNYLFSDGISSRILAADGSETSGGTVFQPFLYTPPGASTSIDPLMTPAPELVQNGVRTIFDPYASTPVFAYLNSDGNWYTCNSSSVYWTTLDSPDLSKEVTLDQIGNVRNGTIGGTSYTTDSLYMVKLIYNSESTHGSVHGATVYGDIYKKGEEVIVVANPEQNYYFEEWRTADGNAFSTENPVRFTVTGNVVLYPVFVRGESLTPMNLDFDIVKPSEGTGGAFTAHATLTTQTDETVAGKPLTFYVLDESGKVVYAETVQTDATGEAAFAGWTPPRPDAKYEAFVSFPGDTQSGPTAEGPVSLVSDSLAITWVEEAEAIYGQTLADVVIAGESANIDGAFCFEDPNQYVGDAGNQTITRFFVPSNTGLSSTSKEMTLTVRKKELNSAMVCVSDCFFTGKAQDGSLVVADGSPSLLKPDDYTVSYSDNVEVGTAKVTITATEEGNYSGSITAEFEIKGEPFGPDPGPDPDPNPGQPNPGPGSSAGNGKSLPNTGDGSELPLSALLIASVAVAAIAGITRMLRWFLPVSRES